MKKQTKHNKRNPFTHLVQNDRDRIEILLEQGMLQKDIAKVLKKDPSTISREKHRINKKRSKKKTYDSEAAQRQADNKRRSSKWKGMKIEKEPRLRKHIISELQKQRSPDEIAGRLKEENNTLRISTDAIYKWLYSSCGQRYTKHLCTKRVKRKKQKRAPKRTMIPNRKPLNERPKEESMTHAEGDTFVSPKKSKSTASVAAVATQREKLFLLAKLDNLKPDTMADGIAAILSRVSIDTLTLDNGIENKHHESFGVPTYFCDPHSPWQKPLVESSIGLLRRWFLPKGTVLTDVTQKQLDEYAGILNNKYRKSLGYRSANEVAREHGILKEA